MGRDGMGLLAISAGIGMPDRWIGTGNERPAIRRGSGVAVSTSGECPACCCRRVRSFTCISIPPNRGTKQSEMCATRTIPPPPLPSRSPPAVGQTSPVPRTVVFVHAHPDDEALLTSGTMAALAAHGHRVVLVVATAGEAGGGRAASGPRPGGRPAPPPGAAPRPAPRAAPGPPWGVLLLRTAPSMR